MARDFRKKRKDRRPYRKGGKNKKLMRYRKKQNSHYVPSKVPLLQPITLKPPRAVRRVVYNNLIKIENNLVSAGGSTSVNPQFITLTLNSPWLVKEDASTAGGGSSWAPNRPMSAHTDGTDPTSGTSYPGLFENDQSIGESYREFCVVGTKVTATYTPVENSQNPDTQPTAFFGIMQTGPSGITAANISSNKVYDQPYSQISKIIGFGNGTSGNVNKVSKGGFLKFNYSAKKMNFVKDITDVKGLWASNQSDQAYHPSEKDSIVIGICPLMANDNTRPLVSGILQLRMEAFMLFGEPSNVNNFALPVEQ